ncbi:MAG: DUF896 domain-containing protein [Eubacterium sp.]|nr:DUF896 domain-containing protein [Eubacterium sp.]
MEQSKIDRINELAGKSKTPEGLTEEEKAEQRILRQEYINSFKANLISQLENTYVVDEKGNKRKLGRKNNDV